MLKNIFKLQDTIDIYVSEMEDPEKVFLTFHKMTTRERIEIIAGRAVAKFISLIDGTRTAEAILREIGDFNKEEALKLIKFLKKNRLIINAKYKEEINHRYSRQISYFDDMILDRRGANTQKILASKKIVILGCGATSSAIAENLVRAGIIYLTLVDYKNIEASSLDRHLFARPNNIGSSKVDVLKNYLKSINKDIKVDTYQELLSPKTDLSKWIDDNTSLIINSCDEPYIGHTSLKIGRYAQAKNLPLYITGGFDAHLMSSGEIIYPPKTPCIDCAQKTFIQSLGDWKPIYVNTTNSPNITTKDKNTTSNFPQNNLIGGAGGLVMMNCFSAHLSCLKILHFLAEDSSFDYRSIRYEYLPNKGILTKFEMKKQENCNVCNI